MNVVRNDKMLLHIQTGRWHCASLLQSAHRRSCIITAKMMMAYLSVD